MIKELSIENFRDIKEKGFFIEEGCGCAEFIYQGNQNIWLVIDRSCRSSGNTSDEKLWEIHRPRFFDQITFSYYVLKGEMKVDCIEEYGNELSQIKLQKELEKRLYDYLREKTISKWGSEYR
ncbi:hypothetical protein AAGG74_15550 [Bacillus mexicanus]|uniref:hypothetical protein n=1 Tax=Bacillus mexicanus TaxID=2834415 RepID=UPI003D20AE02